MKPTIRKIETKDINAIYKLGIHVKEFTITEDKNLRFWPKQTLENFAAQGFSLVIEDKNEVVGFLLAAYQPITKKLTWENMYLEPVYRKKDLADKSFRKSWELAKKEGATVVEALVAQNNQSSQNMLKRLGFIDAGAYHWMLKVEK